MEILEKFRQKMVNSNHTQNFTRAIITAGIISYTAKLRNSLLEQENPRHRPLHLSTKYQEVKRWKMKMMARENWYKDKQQEEKDKNNPELRKSNKNNSQKAGKIQTSTVIFCPSSLRGLLIAMMKENEEKLSQITKFKIRYQEAGGRKLSMLFSTELADGEHCGRECPPCNSGEGRPNCKKRSVLYESRCTICNPESKPSHQQEGEHEQPPSREGIYFGETSRSLHERSLEHVADAKEFKEGSHMVKHWMIHHPSEVKQPPFKFTIISMFRDCLSRQIGEAMRILFSKDKLLNSMNEYLSNNINRVVEDEDKYEKKKREMREEKTELEEKKALEEFRLLKKKTEKRPRESAQRLEDLSQPKIEPLLKRRRLAPFRPINRNKEEEMELGKWLEKAEQRCLRVGMLRERIEKENVEVLKRMEEYRKRETSQHGGTENHTDT